MMIELCCYIECGQKATWAIVYGNAPDDYTCSCGDHLAQMLETVDPQYCHIYPIDKSMILLGEKPLTKQM